jgi:hypothetical protein
VKILVIQDSVWLVTSLHGHPGKARRTQETNNACNLKQVLLDTQKVLSSSIVFQLRFLRCSNVILITSLKSPLRAFVSVAMGTRLLLSSDNIDDLCVLTVAHALVGLS